MQHGVGIVAPASCDNEDNVNITCTQCGSDACLSVCLINSQNIHLLAWEPDNYNFTPNKLCIAFTSLNHAKISFSLHY